MTPELSKRIIKEYQESKLKEVFWSGWEFAISIPLEDYATSVVEYEGKYYKLRHARSQDKLNGSYILAEPRVIGEVVRKEQVKVVWEIVND